jgi:hypothetical protein
MNIKHIILVLICLLIVSCENTNDIKVGVGEGFEIYLSKTPYSYSLQKNYSTMNLDTVALLEDPILRYKDLSSYNTLSHKLTLAISHDSLKIGKAGVYGRMFVVTIDKKPIYCGFKWPVISSIPCNWVYIEEPYKELDNLKDNEIVISFNNQLYPDPRVDKRIIERLKKDRKIK